MSKRPSKLIICYLVFLHLLVVYGLYHYGIESPPPNLPPNPYYDSFKLLLAELDGKMSPGGTVFLGDSITQLLPVKSLSPDAVNFGIGGDSAKGLAERVGSYKSLETAKVLVIQIGTNDVLSGAPGYEQDFTRLAEALPAAPVIYWYAVPPLDGTIEKRANLNRIKDLNKLIENLCRARAKCVFVDLTGKYSDGLGNLRTEFHIGDGIHLNAKGYEIWIQSLRENLIGE